ncbi:MAG: Gfo/Idh/MocA family oxidoreductase [Elusimicrobiaceae bacterium]|nr:Gfo/Idh/MocA family oxidoreductase [Elusimicrobiaceae bacterium]
MAEEKKIRFGVIGAGKIGTFHTRTLANMKEVNLVGVCDPDVMRAQKLAWEHNCTPYTKPEELIGQVDAVIVAAPTPLHHQIGMYCLEHGIHTLVEKPIAVTMEEARDLIQAAKRHNLVLQVGHVERFNPAVVEARKHIQDPRFITINRQGPYDGRMSHISVVLDLMIHDLDLIYTLVPSEVVQVEAVGLSVFSPHEDIANVRLHFANGAVADITASRASFERARYMHVFQPDGYVSVDFMNSRVKTYRKEKPVVNSMNDITVSYPKIEKQLPITAEIIHFMECIRTAKTPAPSGEKGSKALDLALHILEKMNRFDIPKTGHLHTPKPLQAIHTAARAAHAVLDETLGNLKGESR